MRLVFGLPVVAILCLILWRAHFVEHEVRPITLMMQILTLSPFTALTLFTLLGLH